MRDFRAIAEDLHFDVSRARQELLDIEFAIAKCLQRFRAAALIGAGHVRARMYFAHTASAAAGNGFHHHRAAFTQAAEEPFRFFEGCGADRCGQHRRAETLGQSACLHFVAEQGEGFRGRPYKFNPGVVAEACKSRIFAQETVARMNGLAACLECETQYLRPVHIRGWTCTVQGQGFITRPRMQGCSVVLRVDHDARYIEVRRGSRYADCDFATVGDEQPFKHGTLFARSYVPGCGRS
jgi:hypothetical protein